VGLPRLDLDTGQVLGVVDGRDHKGGKVEANNTGIKHIKRTARGYCNPANYKSVILMTSAVRVAA
jgi:transposase